MRTIVITLTVIALGTSAIYAGAAEPGGWSWGLFLGEFGASAGFSYGLGYPGMLMGQSEGG